MQIDHSDAGAFGMIVNLPFSAPPKRLVWNGACKGQPVMRDVYVMPREELL